MNIDLTKLSTPQLRAIKQVLLSGNLACSSDYDRAQQLEKRIAKKLVKENAQLKKLNARRDAVEEAGLDWDQDYWMSFDDGAFNYFLNLFIDQMVKAEKELALSEKTQSIKVPALIAEPELNTLDTVRAGFNELKNRNNGHRQLDE